MLHALAQQDITGRDLSALRVAVSGGASLPEDIMRTFEGKYGIEVLEGYGMSETASSCTFNRPGDRRVLSIGKPLWGVTVRVGDAHDRPLPPGREHVGEILIRGHNVMKGYLGRPEATAEALRGGWLHSGDLGYMDDDGFYFIVDRAKDLVIRGGYNVYPREIEEVLYAHPGILEAAVIGKPDERLGEEVVAVVARREGSELTEEDVIAYCRERLAAYKYPREVRFVAELPKGPSGQDPEVGPAGRLGQRSLAKNSRVSAASRAGASRRPGPLGSRPAGHGGHAGRLPGHAGGRVRGARAAGAGGPGPRAGPPLPPGHPARGGLGRAGPRVMKLDFQHRGSAEGFHLLRDHELCRTKPDHRPQRCRGQADARRRCASLVSHPDREPGRPRDPDRRGRGRARLERL